VRYEQCLDGVRSIAATSVVVYNAHQSVLPSGWAGVDIRIFLKDRK